MNTSQTALIIWVSVNNTVKLRPLEVVGTITIPDHPMCELNSHFGWFWLVKVAPTARIWVQKDKKRNIKSADVFEITTCLSYPCSSYRSLTVEGSWIDERNWDDYYKSENLSTIHFKGWHQWPTMVGVKMFWIITFTPTSRAPDKKHKKLL